MSDVQEIGKDGKPIDLDVENRATEDEVAYREFFIREFEAIRMLDQRLRDTGRSQSEIIQEVRKLIRQDARILKVTAIKQNAKVKFYNGLLEDVTVAEREALRLEDMTYEPKAIVKKVKKAAGPRMAFNEELGRHVSKKDLKHLEEMSKFLGKSMKEVDVMLGGQKA